MKGPRKAQYSAAKNRRRKLAASAREREMLKSRGSPVKISYLPGFEPPPAEPAQPKPKKQRTKQRTKQPKHATIAEGFAAAAADKQLKLDMQNQAAACLRPQSLE